jgi:hypothetical protein
MSMLIVGTVPPPRSPAADSLAHVASRAANEGIRVDVLSPDARSAAHLHAALGGMRLAVHLAARARRYDSLVLRIETGMPLGPRAGRAERALVLGALGLALRLWRDVTIRLDSPIPLPGGLGGRATNAFWRSATRVVVANTTDQAEVLLIPGIDANIVQIEVGLDDVPSSTRTHLVSEEPSREEVQSVLRARAARYRRANSARVDLGFAPHGPVMPSFFEAPPSGRPQVVGLVSVITDRAIRVGVRLLKGR